MAVFLPLSQIEKIHTQMERSKAKLWWVHDSDKTLISEWEEESGTIEDSFNALTEVLNNLEGDWVFVVIRNKLPNKDAEGNFKPGANIKGIQKFEYRVRLKALEGSGAGAGQRSGQNGIGIDLVLGLYDRIGNMQAQMIETKKDAEIAALKEELKAKKSSGGWEEIAQMVAKDFANALRTEVVPAKTGVTEKTETPAKTEAPATTTAPLTEEEQKKKASDLSSSIKTLGKVLGKDAYTFLADLAERADQNPDFFKVFAEKSIKKELNLADLLKPKA